MTYSIENITALIKDRRTIFPENYSDEKIEKATIEAILDNAIWAPTHGNTQPWYFEVFYSAESRRELGALLGALYQKIIPKEAQKEAKLHRSIYRPQKSPVVIAIIMKRDEFEKISETDEICAVACAVQNIYLSCTAHRLGGFWSTPKAIKTNEFKSFLNIGEKDQCLGLFYIGHPAVDLPKGHRKPLAQKSTWR